uniref:[histone H3]-lysine(4) N-trimethyltransferase n=1 Tax=Scleropages formosus TaxID=113540 RepID=A0A8C9W9B6_SCLFO
MESRVERFCSQGKGHGLRALVPLKAGELVFTAQPYAHTVSKSAMKTTCANCFSRKETLLRCSGCKTARYCNPACQRQAWPEHKRECKCLRSLLPRIPGTLHDSVRLVARVIFRLLDPKPSPAEQLYSLVELESHVSEMGAEKMEGLEQLCTMLLLYLKEEVSDLSQLPPGLGPIDLFAKVTCNCFTISDGELKEAGVGLYPSMSLLNHDCKPNCVVMFEGVQLHLRAIQEIKALEELTISYIDVVMPSEDRKRQLQKQYHFLCKCVRCTTADKDADMLAGDEVVWRHFCDAIPRMEQLQSECQWKQLLGQCQALLGDCRGTAVPDRNVYALRLLDLAVDACVNLGQWERPMSLCCCHLVPSCRNCACACVMDSHSFSHSPQTQIITNLNLPAYDIMKVTHGSEHALVVELRRMLDECRAELGCT